MLTWNESIERMRDVTDGLGKKIDQGIFETVVALNALNIHTTASCEGHIEWGLAAPWIDIDPSERATGMRDEMRRGTYEEAKKIGKVLEEEQAFLLGTVSRLLAQFYSTRSVPYHHIIIPNTLGGGRIRLRSIGLEMQTIVEEDVKAQKLLEYQQEMTNFTVFLKSLLAEPIVVSDTATVSQ